MTDAEAGQLIDETVARLGEHFGSVQILITRPMDGGGTHCMKRGCGDWYARQGAAHEFINQAQANENADAMKWVLKDRE